jgi:hypothetical protein
VSSTHRVRLYFCKPILQIFYLYTNASILKTSNASSCHRLIACVCIFVNLSCKYFTKIQTHQSKKGNASSCHCVQLYICKPILQICYKDTNAPIRKTSNASSCSRMRLYFCKPILQICYKDTKTPIRKKATHRRVVACVCIFVNPSCNYFTPIQTHQS